MGFIKKIFGWKNKKSKDKCQAKSQVTTVQSIKSPPTVGIAIYFYLNDPRYEAFKNDPRARNGWKSPRDLQNREVVFLNVESLDAFKIISDLNQSDGEFVRTSYERIDVYLASDEILIIPEKGVTRVERVE